MNQQPHGVAGQVNIYTLDKDSVITANGKHARVVAFRASYDRDYPQFSTVLYARVDLRDDLREPTPTEVLTVARKDQGITGKWILHERSEWETRPCIDFIFVRPNEVTNDETKYWLVKLKLILGEYEKTSKHFVEAETVEEAGNIAFSYEQHCDDAEWDEDQQSFIDDHGGMAYRVSSCTEVSWDEAVVLRKYL